ncbi:MAG: hypothetical protein V8R81_00380 [Clostridia bacterium]
MKKIFIACPISKYIDKDEFTNNNFKFFIEKLYNICQKYVPEVFLALKREEYGKKLMKDTCTELDFEEMKTTDLVIAIPEDSKGTAVELGWASSMKIKTIIILDRSQRYTPLISGLNNITKTEIVWYDKEINEDVLIEVEKLIQKKCKE